MLSGPVSEQNERSSFVMSSPSSPIFDGIVKPLLPRNPQLYSPPGIMPFAFMRIISRGSSPVHAHTKLQVNDPLRRSDRGMSSLPSSPHATILRDLRFVRAPHSSGIPPVNLLFSPPAGFPLKSSVWSETGRCFGNTPVHANVTDLLQSAHNRGFSVP